MNFIMNSVPEIKWPRLAAFMRQHTHDVRNGLNSLDLETSFLEEFVNDDEGRASVASGAAKGCGS